MDRYFDIALNLASDRFSGERDKVIADALARNVNYFNIVCSSLNELDLVKNLNDRLKGQVKESGKIFIDSEKRIATNVNNAIKKGIIKRLNNSF